MGLGPRLMTSAVGGPPKAPKGGPAAPLKLENRIGVQAPPEVIWELLSDLSGWGRWCPIYPKAEGVLRIGARLHLTSALPGLAQRDFTARLIDWVPEEQILWADAPWRGWVKCVHYIEIEKLSEGSCIVSNGELIQGFLADFYHERRRLAMKRGFLAFSEAIKSASETLWQDRQRRAR